MQGAAKFLKANAGPGQAIFVGTAFEFFNYKYYNQTNFETPERPKLFTGGRDKASQMSHVEGVAMLADEDLAPNFTDGIKRGDTVWLIWTYAFGSNKPELPLNWVQIDEKQYPDVRPYTGATIFVSEFKVN